MLRSDRTSSLSVEVASELRDALHRRQKELPPRWLAAVDAETLRFSRNTAPSHNLETIESELALSLLRSRLNDVRPRGIVCLLPSASGANVKTVGSLCARGSVTAIAAVELDKSLSEVMLQRLVPLPSAESSSSDASATGNDDRQSLAAIACDCTFDLPLRHNFPRPRLYLCLGNVLGSTTTVGAVRMLRVLRTTMSPGDTIVLGLEVAPRADLAQDISSDAAAARHLGALALVNSATGAAFDLQRFDCRARYDEETRRIETHLVARRAFELEVPGVCDVRFRKGESIRTAVSCLFDRTRVSAMMAGVGLTLRDWTTNPDSTYVVASASPAI